MPIEIEDLANLSINGFNDPPKSYDPKTKIFITNIINADPKTQSDYDRLYSIISRKLKYLPRKSTLNSYLIQNNYICNGIDCSILQQFLIKKKARSYSGVLNVSVVTLEKMCPYKCVFCPHETIANGAKADMPKSYHSNEPAVARAVDVNFNIAEQVWLRLKQHSINGHLLLKDGIPSAKIDGRLLGDTFTCYSHEYQDDVVRDFYYACNVAPEKLSGKIIRERLSLEVEITLNETTECRVIGLSIETRPDQITRKIIQRLRKYGVTIVEIGVQHTNDDVLVQSNRGHGIQESIDAIQLMKAAGLKVVIHVMPDLPGSTPELDIQMFNEVFLGENICPDQIKIYPTMLVKYADALKNLKESGGWRNYAEECGGIKLIDVLVHAKSIVPEWVRIIRVPRDFEHASERNNFLGYESGCVYGNIRQNVLAKMNRMDPPVRCRCIRCREVKGEKYDLKKSKTVTRKYNASRGIEVFITKESPDMSTLYGLVRLRLQRCENFIPELENTAIIREVHVYGYYSAIGDKNKNDGKSQHKGIGKELIKIAEKIAVENRYEKMAVISGIGVREYYRKLGYKLEGTYMVKQISRETEYVLYSLLSLFVLFLSLFIYNF